MIPADLLPTITPAVRARLQQQDTAGKEGE